MRPMKETACIEAIEDCDAVDACVCVCCDVAPVKVNSCVSALYLPGAVPSEYTPVLIYSIPSSTSTVHCAPSTDQNDVHCRRSHLRFHFLSSRVFLLSFLSRRIRHLRRRAILASLFECRDRRQLDRRLSLLPVPRNIIHCRDARDRHTGVLHLAFQIVSESISKTLRPAIRNQEIH